MDNSKFESMCHIIDPFSTPSSMSHKKAPSFSSWQLSSCFVGAIICKNLIMGPLKLIEVSLEGDFKDSITRKHWLGLFFRRRNRSLHREIPSESGKKREKNAPQLCLPSTTAFLPQAPCNVILHPQFIPFIKNFQTAVSDSRQCCVVCFLPHLLRLLDGNRLERPGSCRESRPHVPTKRT